jgi:hypothetical protein
MSRYFNDFDAMSGESLEHGFGEKAHKYIDKVKTKSGKWRYIYKKKIAEALDKDYEKGLPKGYKKTVDGDTIHYKYKDKEGNYVSEDVEGRGLIRTHHTRKTNVKMYDSEEQMRKDKSMKMKAAPKKKKKRSGIIKDNHKVKVTLVDSRFSSDPPKKKKKKRAK